MCGIWGSGRSISPLKSDLQEKDFVAKKREPTFQCARESELSLPIEALKDIREIVGGVVISVRNTFGEK